MKKIPKIKKVENNIIYFDDGTQWTADDVIALQNKMKRLEKENERLRNKGKEDKPES